MPLRELLWLGAVDQEREFLDRETEEAWMATEDLADETIIEMLEGKGNLEPITPADLLREDPESLLESFALELM